MIVCLCKAINCAQIKETLPCKVVEVCKQTEAGTVCGGCLPTIKEIVKSCPVSSEAEQHPYKVKVGVSKSSPGTK